MSTPRQRRAEQIGDWGAQRPDLDPELMGIRAALLAISARLGRDIHRLARTVGLSGSELRVLFTLRRVGAPYELRPTDLFEALIVPSGTMTRQIDRLERMDMVVRTDDPDDRRGAIVRLTERGLRVADDTMTVAVRDSPVSAATERIPPAERTQLNRLLLELLRNIDELDADTPPKMEY
jgi:DNA-binding MarR family transcriptional regulator